MKHPHNSSPLLVVLGVIKKRKPLIKIIIPWKKSVWIY